MRKITFDIETKNIFSDVGRADPALLSIAVVGVHDSKTDAYKTYFEEELEDLWPILENADSLIGYNSDHFDIPLLNKYYPGDLKIIKSIDLLKEIKNRLGRRIRLNSVAEATLGEKKSGSGLEALSWWKAGEYDKVCKYCLKDVRITKDLYDYAILNNTLRYKDFGEIKTIELDTSDWEKKDNSSMTHTLPF